MRSIAVAFGTAGLLALKAVIETLIVSALGGLSGFIVGWALGVGVFGVPFWTIGVVTAFVSKVWKEAR